MPTTLYLSPTASQSAAHAILQARRIQANNPLAPVQFLLPTAEDIALLSVRLGNSLGIRLRQFYRLAVTILDQTGWPHHPIGPAATRRLVRDILAGMNENGELTTFGPVWELPGFQQVALEWLREMKTQDIRPQDVAALPAGPGWERDRQLSTLYSCYQRRLQQEEQTDADGLLWLAADALRQNPDLLRGGDPLLVVGFDQFNRVQLQLLQLLSERLARMDIYLLWDDTRPAGSLPLTRLSNTRKALTDALSPREEVLLDQCGDHPTLVRLRRAVLEPAAVGIGDTAPPAIRAVEAPSRESESREALRDVKRLLLDGVPPAEIALLAPQPGAYRRIVQAVASEYGLPVHLEQPLAQNSAVSALLNLLGLFPDFPWQQTFDALRSPYIAQTWLSTSQVDDLDLLSRQRPVVAGRDQWQYALALLQLDTAGEVDDDLGSPPLVATLAPSALEAIRAGLMAFFDLLTPAQAASYAEHTLWVQRAILGLPDGNDTMLAGNDDDGDEDGEGSLPTSLNLVRCGRQGVFAARDLRALAQVTRALRDLVDASGLGTGGGSEAVPWEIFRADAVAAIQASTLPPDPAEDAVWFGALESGRNRPVQCLLVLGVSEGEFPRLPVPDVFYSAVERASLPLPLVRQSPADDACLWWQVLAGCSQQLTLLRPRLDENGAAWLPSAYWEDVLNKVSGLAKRVERPPITPAVTPDSAASPGELLTALATGHGCNVPPTLLQPWENAQRAYRVMEQRQSWRALGAHEGLLAAPDLQADLARRYGPDHTWSFSRLGNYGTCPYLFFARDVLDLKPLPDPEAGLDHMQLGSLYHALLEKLYQRLTGEALTPAPSTKDAVLDRLDAACREAFPTAPARYGFRPGDLWEYEQQEMRRVLSAFMTWECDKNNSAARWQPYLQEWHFGMPGGDQPRLWVDGAFYLHGVVDRLDRDDQGRLRLVDYKSGSTAKTGTEVDEGRALQTVLYTLAARELAGSAGVAESLYLHIPSRKSGGALTFPGDEGRLEAAVATAVAFVRQVRVGRFPAAPGDKACSKTCEMDALCRRTRQSIAKVRRSENP